MQNNIIWEGINDESLENCNVLTNNNVARQIQQYQ